MSHTKGSEATPLLSSSKTHSIEVEKEESASFNQIQSHAETGVVQEGASKDPEAEFSVGKLSRRSKYTLVLLALANFFSSSSFSLLAPFFPEEAEKKGVSSTVTGFIFSIFELLIFVSSPLYGNYMSRIGPKFMFNTGILIGGACSILFGVLEHCPRGNVFVIMCFLCRSVEALGLSAFITASFAIISHEFPKHIATVFGLLETASGIGLMVGPALGGGLYQVGGFGLPFYVMGCLIFLNGLLVYKFLPSPDNVQKKRQVSVLTLLKSGRTIVTLLTILVASIGITFLDPTLANHFEPFHLSTALVGLMFVVAPGLYGITTSMWGYLCDTKDIRAPLIILGNLAIGIGYLFIGPSPFLPFLPTDQLWVIILGLVILGLFIGCAVTPTMKTLVIGALDVGLEDNLDTYGIVSGLFNSMWCLGGFLGPTLGGVLIENVGFNYGVTVVAGLSLFACVVTSLHSLIVRCMFKQTSSSSEGGKARFERVHKSDEVICSVDPEILISQSFSAGEKRTQSAIDHRRKSYPSFMRSLSSPGPYMSS